MKSYTYKYQNGEIVNEADYYEASEKLENNPDLMLRLLDLIFLGQEDTPVS